MPDTQCICANSFIKMRSWFVSYLEWLESSLSGLHLSSAHIWNNDNTNGGRQSQNYIHTQTQDELWWCRTSEPKWKPCLAPGPAHKGIMGWRDTPDGEGQVKSYLLLPELNSIRGRTWIRPPSMILPTGLFGSLVWVDTTFFLSMLMSI